MRNLKRALSLALASVMLLGMMVTGAGAASNSFTDFDQIVNQEAAEVTSGLGIFDGYTDGSFGPENVVTRAEMAVIICKLLNGSDVDPGNFTDISKFTDVPSWAEGYVNYCNSMGIVVGVGDGKFDPNRTVSTVEAATMLLKALGYFIEEDQLGADWKTVVTGRATSLHLYGELTLSVDEALTRDNVAELVFHTLFAQRVAYDDNRHLYVKNTDRDVVVTNGTDDKDNTFAMNTFGMWYVDGIVTANSYTDDSLSETTNNKPRTMVWFEGSNVNLGDGPVAQYAFEYTTGLDMIGHAARTYYSIEKRAPVVYAIVDRATKTEYITYDSNTTRLADAANEAGFRKNSVLLTDSGDYLVNYDWNVTVKDLANTSKNVVLNGPDVAKTLLLISNSSDYKVDYVIVLDQYLDTVRRVVDKDTLMKYDLTSGNGSKQNITLEELAEKDYVVVTDIGKQGEMFNLYKPETAAATITKITGVSDGRGTVKSILADGTEYKGSPVAIYGGNRVENLENTTDFEDIATIGESTLILDFQGKVIGLGEPEKVTNYAYAAQFGVWHTGGSLNTEYKLTVKLHFIDGTSGVYLVNTGDSKNINTFYKLKMSAAGGATSAAQAENTAKILNTGSTTGTYNPKLTYLDTISVDEATGALQNSTNGGLGVYKVSVRADDTVVMTALKSDMANQVDVGTRLVPGHSTLVKNNGSNVTSTFPGSPAFYQTNKTVYFYVDGSYTADTLSVGTRTGVANAKGITHDTSDHDENLVKETFEQIFVTDVPGANSRDTVEAVMIYGLDLGANTDLYFYRHGNYHITTRANAPASSRASDNDLVITYDLYTAAGEVYSKTYDNDGKGYDMDTAKNTVESKPTGWYEIGSKDLKDKYVLDNNSDVDKIKFNPASTNRNDKTKNVYVLNAQAEHDEFVKNIYTRVDNVGGIILDNALVVDACNSGLDSVSDIASACKANHLVRISYTYKVTGDDAFKVSTVFVTGYDPAENSKPSVSHDGLYTVYNPLTGGLDVFDDVKNPATSEQLAAAAKAAFEGAGFTVTNVYPEGLGNKAWVMTIAKDGMTQYVTNKQGGGSFGYFTYMDRVREMVKINVNGVFSGYYPTPDDGTTIAATLKAAANTSIIKGSAKTLFTTTNVAGEFKYPATSADKGVTIDFGEAVKVTITGTGLTVKFGSPEATQVYNNEYVPVNAELVITYDDPSTAKAILVKRGDETVTTSSIGKKTSVTYPVTAGKPVDIGAGEYVNLVVGAGMSVTYLPNGVDDVETNYVTVNAGTYQLAKSWTLKKINGVGTNAVCFWLEKGADEKIGASNLIADDPKQTAASAGTSGVISKDAYVYAAQQIEIAKVGGDAGTGSTAKETVTATIPAQYNGDTEQTVATNKYVAVGTVVNVETVQTGAGTYVTVDGVKTGSEADGVDAGTGSFTVSAKATGKVVLSVGRVPSEPEVVLPSEGLDKDSGLGKELYDMMVSSGLSAADAEAAITNGDLIFKWSRPDAGSAVLNITPAAGNTTGQASSYNFTWGSGNPNAVMLLGTTHDYVSSNSGNSYPAGAWSWSLTFNGSTVSTGSFTTNASGKVTDIQSNG